MSGNIRKSSTATELNYQVKTKEGDTQSAYLESKIVGSTYITITEEDGTYGKRLKIEADESAIGGTIVTDKVKVSGSDSTAEYLDDKIEAGDGIETTCDDDTVTISLDAELSDLDDVDDSLSPSDKDILVYDGTVDNEWEASYGLEEVHTGGTDKVLTSRGVSNVLQTLIVNTNEDFASGYTPDANQYKTIDIDVSRMMYVSKTSTTLSTNYPTTTDLEAALPTFVTGVDPDRGPFGDMTIKTTEAGAGSDSFYGALIRFTLDEDYINSALNTGATISLDIMFKLPDVTGTKTQVDIAAVPYFVRQGDTAQDDLTAVSGKLKWEDDGSDRYEYLSLDITGPEVDTGLPIPMAVFIVCASASATPDSGYTETNEAVITAIRVRYLKQCLQVRSEDVTL